MIKTRLIAYAAIAANGLLLQITATATQNYTPLKSQAMVYAYAPVKDLQQPADFEKLLKQIIAAYEKDFIAINQGVLEKKAGDNYKTQRYKTGIHLPDLPQAYLELDNPKKSKTYIAYSAATADKAAAIKLFTWFKQQLDTIDFQQLDLFEDEVAKLPAGALKMASYKALGLDTDMSEKMSEIQIDIILEEELNADVAKPNQPKNKKYKVRLSVGQQ